MVHTLRNFSRGPRRRIEKKVSRISVIIGTSAQHVIIHTAEDRKTLVRTILQLNVTQNSAGDQTYDITLKREPGGFQTSTLSVSQELDQNTMPEEMWEYRGKYMAESVEPTSIFVDLKSQRKLSTGDELVLSHIGNIASGSFLVGIITMFFKE